MSISAAEPKYQALEESASKEDLEVAEILTTIVENTAENTRSFSTIKESEIPQLDSSTIVPKPFSPDHPLDPTTLIQTTLLDLITKMVSDHELQKKHELPVDARYIECLKQITEKQPKYFASFETSLLSIVKDGSISVADFPEIVKMVMELYIVLYSVHPKDIVDMCSNILKTVFVIAVKERVIVAENENEVIADFDNFIDSIVELLKMHIQLSGGWDTVTCNFGKLFGF
jgi:hypothetical protein